jgi:hypothetical protein
VRQLRATEVDGNRASACFLTDEFVAPDGRARIPNANVGLANAGGANRRRRRMTTTEDGSATQQVA